jgi:hypothetical protein
MTKKRVVSQSTYVDPSKVGQRKSAGTRKVYRGTLEAQWTCNSCGRTGIPGRAKRCPSCGNPKDTSEEYEAPTTPGKYLTPEALKAMGVDPTLHLSDEKCDYCGATLKPGAQKCPNCGAALRDVGYTTHVCPACERESNEEKCPNCGSPTEEKLVAHRQAKPPKPPSIQRQSLSLPPFLNKLIAILKQPKYLVPTLIILSLMCCGICLAIYASISRTDTATVTDIAWERTIAIEEHQYNEHGDWTLPPGADLHSQEERIHHYDKVQIGTEKDCGYEETCETESVYDHTERTCYDDGTCDEHDVYRDESNCTNEYVCDEVPIYEDVPVVQTWYAYSVWEWVNVRQAVARGSDADVHWPEVELGNNQREGERSERCVVTLTNKKRNSYPFSPPCSELSRYPRGSEWQIKRNSTKVLEVQPQK